jgi:hypothetical protein
VPGPDDGEAGHHEPDFSDKEIAFVARIGEHLGHGLRDALLREQAAAGLTAAASGVIVLGRDGTVRSLTDQASFWLGQFPPDRGTGLELPAAVHAVARRALAAAGPHPAGPSIARVRLTSGQWLTVQAASLRSDDPRPSRSSDFSSSASSVGPNSAESRRRTGPGRAAAEHPQDTAGRRHRSAPI